MVDRNVATTTGLTASIPTMLAMVEAIGGRAKAQEVAAQLGVDAWTPAHDSSLFGLNASRASTYLLNKAAFWRDRQWQVDVHDGMDDLYHYLGFVLSAILMGMAFLSVSLLISVLAPDRMRASGVAIALWFFFVLIFDLVLTGALVISGGALSSGVFGTVLMLNSADIFRLLNIFSSAEVQTMYGLATVMPERLTNPLC